MSNIFSTMDISKIIIVLILTIVPSILLFRCKGQCHTEHCRAAAHLQPPVPAADVRPERDALRRRDITLGEGHRRGD